MKWRTLLVVQAHLVSMWEIKAVIVCGLEQGGESGLSTCLARVLVNRLEQQSVFLWILFLSVMGWLQEKKLKSVICQPQLLELPLSHSPCKCVCVHFHSLVTKMHHGNKWLFFSGMSYLQILEPQNTLISPSPTPWNDQGHSELDQSV